MCWCIELEPDEWAWFPSPMANTLYVGNLPFKISDEELAAHFASAGEVLEVPHERERGSDRSNGCGFSEMTDAEGAAQAVSTLDGSELAGRTLTVGLARP